MTAHCRIYFGYIQGDEKYRIHDEEWITKEAAGNYHQAFLAFLSTLDPKDVYGIMDHSEQMSVRIYYRKGE